MEDLNQIQIPMEQKTFIPPKFTPRRAGRLYSWSCISIQLIASALYIVTLLILKILEATGFSSQLSNNILTIMSYMTQPVLAAFVIGYLIKFKVTLPEAGIRKSKPLPFLIGIILCIGIIFIVPIAESFFQTFLSILGYQPNFDVIDQDVNYTPGMMVITFILVAIFPAIFEELIMRGIILESTKGFGTWQACLINGFAFSLFHANPSQCFYTFIMGAVFAFVAIRCNSIIPTMIAHFLNNGYSLILEFMGISLSDNVYYILFTIGMVLTILSFIYFIKVNRQGEEKPSIHKPPFFHGATAGIIFNSICWLFIFYSQNIYLNFIIF